MTLKRILSLFICTACAGVVYSQTQIDETFIWDGNNREYTIYIPASYDGTSEFPLVFNFHGGGDFVPSHMSSADMRPIADTANFILVYPQAIPDPGNGGSTSWMHKEPTTHDDVPFVEAMIDSISMNYNINTDRVYACGYSLGGEFTFELSCQLNNRIAAIGAVARTMGAGTYNNCSPVHPTGVITVLGTADPISDYNGVWYLGVQYYMSADEQNSYWVSHNNCEPTAVITPIADTDPSDGSTVERHTWANMDGCVYVEELKVINGGHDWPGSSGNMDIDASKEIWKFVSNYNLNGIIECSTNSIDQVSEVNIQVFPNPMSNQLIIESNYSEPMTFHVYNILGKAVLTGRIYSGENSIDVTSLKSNFYTLSIGNETTKLVKID
ncbi:MAG: T9SS type A sorting domain-containing protein [Crocinitomicaceae bacterium]|nr:T9SS type A sorting domain-containing protein [Crocinitomicaceae bacterium]